MLNDKVAEFLFHQGTNYYAYKYMGAHKRRNGKVVFRTWAPKAENVFLAADFNCWSKETPLKRITDGGIWACEIENDKMPYGAKYKFIIEHEGRCIYKSDPYAFYSETQGQTASILYNIEGYRWHDRKYLEKRKEIKDCLLNDIAIPKPVNIYEVHLGSWRKHPDGSYYSYTELADELSDYVLSMGYTHIEIMPVAEYPFDGSWGYQGCGYYAPTSRFGCPKDFMAFVDKMHTKGIGVILDWVPAHFPKDEHGLYEFDGGPLYEYSGETRKENKGWGTRVFDVARNEVESFLISNAFFWADKYHIDGLRVDAVASMLYLDYDRKGGEWIPNEDGSNISRESTAFFKKLNSEMKRFFPDVLMIAEESTAFPNVTKGYGLGFNLKWNMGWMNDTLSYIGTDTYFRNKCQNMMSFSTHYAFSENFVLPISHDEVVHLKKSLIQKMFGDDKYNQMKAYLCWMYAHPGKKLIFMGTEFAQEGEWNYKTQLEWFLLDEMKHKDMQDFVRSLNMFYKKHSEFWELDGVQDGFRWIDADRCDESAYIFERINKEGDKIICVFNFSTGHYDDFTFNVDKGTYKEIFSTVYNNNTGSVKSHGKDGKALIKVSLPPFSASFFKKSHNKRNKLRK